MELTFTIARTICVVLQVSCFVLMIKNYRKDYFWRGIKYFILNQIFFTLTMVLGIIEVILCS